MTANDLLTRMHPDDRRDLLQECGRQRFSRGDVLIEGEQKAAAAYFIVSGIASIVRPAGDDRTTEIALVGPESFAGMTIVMADGISPYRIFVQSDRLDAVVVDAAALRTLFDENVRFRRLLLGVIEAQTIQIAESLAAALWQQTRARLARWLLMYRDRLRSDRLEITHEFMALMVGAQRSKITATIHELEGEGAIHAQRGLIIVRDAACLEQLASGSYGRHDKLAANHGAISPP